VLFDIDGTLIQTGGAGVRAFAETARQEFSRPGGTEGMQFGGRTDVSLVREFFTRHGIEASPGNFARFLGTYLFWLDHLMPRLEGAVLPGVWSWLHGLRALKAPPLIGLLTGNARLGAEIKLRHFRLWEEFALGAFSDDAEDRDALAAVARDRAAAALGGPVAGAEVLVIGDTPRDIACARAIGARVLAVATGRDPLAALQGHGPDLLAASLRDVSPATACA
jgi:phosphoglycolate phosphatase-like HAD superfamily hydrolase